MNTIVDAIVLGCGGVGSAALYRLARRGLRVVGIDQFAPPHDRGSSHGETRIIRAAYFEHPDYVPLAQASWSAWRELETATGATLLEATGLAEFGPPDGIVVPGVLRAARQHNLNVHSLTPDEAATRWPALAGHGLDGVYEPDAGVLRVERCVAAHLDAARAAGAETCFSTRVSGWTCGDAIAVQAGDQEFLAERLIVTAGAWAGGLLADVGVPLTPRRQVVAWHAAGAEMAVDAGCPCFLFELPTGVFYGFPDVDGRGAKVGDHAPGAVVADPSNLDRDLHDGERLALEAFVRARLPFATPTPLRHSACMYTMSPDEHFVVDRHPSDPRVVFAAGLSGHGFKFAPVLGQALADLAVDGATSLPIGFLSLARFARADGRS